MKRPVIGMPMGDPAGIGPEIILKTLMKPEIYEVCKPLIIGDAKVLEKIDTVVGSGLRFNTLINPDEGLYHWGTVDVLSLDNIAVDRLRYGEVQKEAGKAAYQYIEKTVELTKTGKINAVATTPINKEAIKAANVDFIGHTEMLAGLTDTHDPLTMFQVYNMRVFFLSRHVSLKKACELIKVDRLVDYTIRCDKALHMLGLQKRKIAIAGLNPHCGEHGLFGDEEVKEIEPAVKILQERGIEVVGPIPADSVFSQALKGKYDAVLSLYHDQGHIATKTVDFEKTISLTLGLPFLRTSVDHGTAFDIAGQGIASSVSMEEAVKLAALYCKSYKA